MNEQKLKQNVSNIVTNAVTATRASSDTIHSRQWIARNVLLIWEDTSIDKSKQDYQNSLAQLQSVINDVNIFTQRDEGIDFLTEIDRTKAFLIVESTIGRQIVPLIHDILQLDKIYIFCDNKSGYEQWTKKWVKIKGVHTEFISLSQALQLAVKQWNQDSIALSFIKADEEIASQNLNQLDPSFMYTQIFKEILLGMQHNQKSFTDFVLFWRHHYIDNTYALNVIAEFKHGYSPESSIKWYTREYFIYQMLNRALRTLEADTIINMGFFIRDLHIQIQQLYQTQVHAYCGKPFIVYRGQGLSITDFEKLKKTKGGLMSFNNFLSTSQDRDISFVFANSASTGTNTVGVLFEITIDPSVSSIPFASIRGVSYFQTEEEILFSMHTVFRIGEINKIGNKELLYQVDLQLTADDDQELRTLTDRIRNEVVNETGWIRLIHLLLKLRQFDKAEELCNILLEQASDECERKLYNKNLGYIKNNQGDYSKALSFYKKGLEIEEKTISSIHPSLANSYNNIGGVYTNMGEYSKALLFFEQGLEIEKKTLPPNHPLLANFYNSIGGVYYSMGEYSKALLLFEQGLEIRHNILPANHPSLAASYNNIGGVYFDIGECCKALSFYEKGLKIFEKTLPASHPLLATSYNNIGGVYTNMGEYSKALSFYEKAVKNEQKTLPSNHPSLASSYNNIGEVYRNMGEYLKALSFYEKGLEIFEKTLPPNHPLLANSYSNIGGVYTHMGEYSKALLLFEKGLEIRQKSLPTNHHLLATSYNNIGLVYTHMEEYSKALLLFEKAIEIFEKTLPPNYPSLATSYNNIGLVYISMGDYSKALTFYENALNIFQSSLPLNHPNIKTVLESIEYIKRTL